MPSPLQLALRVANTLRGRRLSAQRGMLPHHRAGSTSLVECTAKGLSAFRAALPQRERNTDA